MRLIDADALKEELAKRTPHFAQRIALTLCFDAIRDAPTVDAVPIVRCKDCKHRTGDGWLPCTDMAVNDNWYCADGERKEQNDE